MAKETISQNSLETPAQMQQILAEKMQSRIIDFLWENSPKQDEMAREILVDWENLKDNTERRALLRAIYESAFGRIAGDILDRSEMQKIAEMVNERTPLGEEVKQSGTPIDETLVYKVMLNWNRKESQDPPAVQTLVRRATLTSLQVFSLEPAGFLQELVSSPDPIHHEKLFNELVKFSPMQRRLFIAAVRGFFFQNEDVRLPGTVRSEMTQVLSEWNSRSKKLPTLLNSNTEELREWCTRFASVFDEARTMPNAEAESTTEELRTFTTENVLERLKVPGADHELLAKKVLSDLSADDQRVLFRTIAEAMRPLRSSLPFIYMNSIGVTLKKDEVAALRSFAEHDGVGANFDTWSKFLEVTNRKKIVRESL